MLFPREAWGRWGKLIGLPTLRDPLSRRGPARSVGVGDKLDVHHGQEEAYVQMRSSCEIGVHAMGSGEDRTEEISETLYENWSMGLSRMRDLASTRLA